jgi:hypothetical protein
MRTLAVLPVFITVITGVAAASDCGIERAVQTDGGPNAGVTGKCSNNGEPIECRNASDGSISCTGPEGNYSGDNLDALIASACGCDT